MPTPAWASVRECHPKPVVRHTEFCNVTDMVGSEEKAVAELVADVENAWNTHDMRGFAARFAEDADFINVRGWWWRGRDEIEHRHALLHETMFRNSTMSVELASTKGVCPGVLLAHVRWEMIGHEFGGPDQTSEPRTGIWSWVVRERDGSVEIVSSHNTDTVDVPRDHPLS
jgi:uncharacterized protein (TIGR02246 family)